MFNSIKTVLLGGAIGDALGVPFEFNSRQMMKQEPCTGMKAMGSHGQLAGTWSDDTSLTMCLAEALAEPVFSLETVGQNFVKWRYENFWTARGEVFDIGGTTEDAIFRLSKEVPPHASGSFHAISNGNGSLMRIAPLVFLLRDKPVSERFDHTNQVSAITHGHIDSVVACWYFIEFLRLMLDGHEKHAAYAILQSDLPEWTDEIGLDRRVLKPLHRLLTENIGSLEAEDIGSSGFVISTLEASISSLLRTTTFREALLTAVNLGDDTDTVASVCGSHCGLIYGVEAIPSEWLGVLSRREDIEDLAWRMAMWLTKSIP